MFARKKKNKKLTKNFIYDFIKMFYNKTDLKLLIKDNDINIPKTELMKFNLP